MKTVSELHHEAMQSMNEAYDAKAVNQDALYNSKLSRAFELEKEAAFKLLNEDNTEPTRSVLFRSAASLAFELNRPAQTKLLVTKALKGKPHDEIKEELIELLHAANDELARLPANNGEQSSAVISVNQKTKKTDLKISNELREYYNLLPELKSYSYRDIDALPSVGYLKFQTIRFFVVQLELKKARNLPVHVIHANIEIFMIGDNEFEIIASGPDVDQLVNTYHSMFVTKVKEISKKLQAGVDLLLSEQKLYAAVVEFNNVFTNF